MILIEEYLNNKNLIKEDNFSYYTLDNPEKFLNKCVNNGYVLHGSTRKILGYLKPYTSNDLSKEFGNQTGIYLTSIPLVAMFCAFVSGTNSGQRRSSIETRIENENIEYLNVYLGVENIQEVKDEGYVYIFKDSVIDESYGKEHISKKDILPEYILKIYRKDLRYTIEEIKFP